MSRLQKLLERILRGTADANLTFDELRYVFERLGFKERIRGSHHIFSRSVVAEILNLSRVTVARPSRTK